MKKILRILPIIFIFATVSATSFSITSKDKTYIPNCPIEIKLNIDTKKEEINTIDIKLIKQDYEIINFIPNKKTFKLFTKPKISKAKKTIPKDKPAYYIMATTNSKDTFQWKTDLWKLIILPKSNKELNIEFYMIPNYKWDDSNAYTYHNQKTTETLNKVRNLTLHPTKGICNKTINKQNTKSGTNKEFNFLEYTLAQAKQNIIVNDLDENFPLESIATNQNKTNKYYVDKITSTKTNTNNSDNKKSSKRKKFITRIKEIFN